MAGLIERLMISDKRPIGQLSKWEKSGSDCVPSFAGMAISTRGGLRFQIV